MGAWGIVIFIVVYVIATILLVPGSALTVGAGFVFGLGWGLLAVSLGSTTGAALAFLITRFVAREKIASMARNNENFRRIDAAIGEQGAKLVFLLRLSPLIPFNLSNYFYGLTSVKFWPYVLASWIGMLPGTLLYVYLGTVGRTGLQGCKRDGCGAHSAGIDSSRRRSCRHRWGHRLGDKNRPQRPERACREVIVASTICHF